MQFVVFVCLRAQFVYQIRFLHFCFAVWYNLTSAFYDFVVFCSHFKKLHVVDFSAATI